MAGIQLCGNCTTKVPKRYDTGCPPVKRTFGSTRALFVHCSDTWTDLNDTAALGEWETKLSAATPNVISTPGYTKVEIGESTGTTLADFGKKGTIPGDSSVPFTITTYTNAASVDDVEDWFQSIFDNQASYQFNYFDYEGDRLYTDEVTVTAHRAGGGAIATTYAIGFDFSFDKEPEFRPGPDGYGHTGAWVMTGTFTVTTVQRSVEIPGIRAVVEANA